MNEEQELSMLLNRMKDRFEIMTVRLEMIEHDIISVKKLLDICLGISERDPESMSNEIEERILECLDILDKLA